MKYRKKPIVIEAEQWWPGSDVEGVEQPIPYSIAEENHIDDFWRYGWIKTLEGGHIVSPGDYIITGIKGEKYPCKTDIFKETYDPVDE